MLRLIYVSSLMLFLAACASAPEPAPRQTSPVNTQTPSRPFNPRGEIAHNQNMQPSKIPEYNMIPRARPLPDIDPKSLPPSNGTFDPNYLWAGTEINAGLTAYRASCAKILKRRNDRPFSTKAGVWGLVSDWQPTCRRLINTPTSQALSVLAEEMEPVRISYTDLKGKFTGYFEPVYTARTRPMGKYTEPILMRPKDLKTKGKRATQILENGKTRPYPARAKINTGAMDALAYAHPADLFFLQIQGSGRLELEDGSTIRAEYGGHNGHGFASTANWLIKNGHIRRSQASMQGIRAWMDRAGPKLTRQAMNANPRYIFFNPAKLGDPNQGPPGATSDRLTPLGSMAVDPKFIPYHLPLIVETNSPGLGGLWRGLLISQDTGDAIKGPIRGDIYFGTGYNAGQRAGTMNAPGKLWVLLPRRLIQRLENQAYAGLTTGVKLG